MNASAATFDAQLWRRFVGTWTTEATHPAFPGVVVRGKATFELLGGERFIIQRSEHEHPEIPDAISVIGVTDEQLAMHYFDSRGVYRIYAVALTEDTWSFWRDAPGFSQRFTGTFGDDGATITARGQLSRDGAIWEDDLAVTYRKLD